MDEFIRNKGKVLTIENPISMFKNILSLNTNNESQRSERWQSLNTLMAINNHRRINQLEEQLSMEQARVTFLHDVSDQMEGKVMGLEKSIDFLKQEIGGQKKSLTMILTLVKIISNHQKLKNNYGGSLISKFKGITASIIQNAVIFGLVQLIMRITWLDSMIDGLMELLRLGNIVTKKSIERSRFLVKLSVSITLFLILRTKIKELLQKLKGFITFLT